MAVQKATKEEKNRVRALALQRIATDKDFALSILKMATQLYRDGDYEDAVKMLKDVIEGTPHEDQPY